MRKINGKKIGIGLLCVLLLTGTFLTGHYAGAASKTPGSAEDPLVTLGYLEKRLAGTDGSYKKVQLNKGDSLLGEEGTCVIVLGGSVVAAEGSLVDVTAGTLTEEDTSMFLYHSYIVSESDTGCEALSSCTLFVSGTYTIK